MCVVAALDVKTLWRFDLLLCSNHTRIHRDYWDKGKSLKNGCHCTAAAVLVLHTDVTAHIPRTWYKHTNAHTYTQKHRLWLSRRRELTALLLLCCTVTATSTDPGGGVCDEVAEQ